MSAGKTLSLTDSCSQCGAVRLKGAKFCWLCGASVASQATVAKIVTTPAPAPAPAQGVTGASVLWIIVIVAAISLLGLVGSFWEQLQTDPLFRNVALGIAVPAVAIIALITARASQSGSPNSGTALALGALGTIGVLFAALCAALAVVVASAIAFIFTCGAAGRLPP